MSANGVKYRLLVVALLALLVAGCGYRFTAGHSSLLKPGQTVWVPFLKNSTVFANAPVVLKRAMFDQFAAQRGIMAAATPEEGDLLIEGVLTGYGSGAVSYAATDTVKEYRLTISAEITLRRKGDTKESKPLWKGTVSAWQDYVVSANIELQRNSEEAALVAASRKLAQQLIWQIDQDY